MDPRLLRLYEEELRFMRSAGAEFRDQYPKIAGRLGIESNSCADPYVERLLEGVAFLAARVQLKIQSRFPDFTHQLMELVYPHLTAPIPSAAMVAFEPRWDEGALAAGVRIPAQAPLTAPRTPGQATACQFRTAHDVTLWPLRLTSAEYLRNPGVIAARGIALQRACRCGIQLSFEITGGATVGDLAITRLPLHLKGADGDDVPTRLYELFHAATVAVGVRTDEREAVRFARQADVRRLGFEREQAMFPPVRRVFEGYRLLQEYFTLPQRFLYADVPVPVDGVGDKAARGFQLIVLFDRADDRLVHEIDKERFVLYATPALNLFPQVADRIHLAPESTQYHIVPDRNRPVDFEVHSVRRVSGISPRFTHVRTFDPMYKVDHLSAVEGDRAYYSTSREARIESSSRRRRRAATPYLGTEVYLSLHDTRELPYGEECKQLEVELLCTNRGLPLEISAGQQNVSFVLETGDPVESVRLIHGPTRPRSAVPAIDMPWRLISHLSLNYLSLIDQQEEGHPAGAEGLRALLGLYVDPADREIARRINGLVSARSEPVVRRMPVRGPLCFGNGVAVRLCFDDDAFVGSGCFLLGAVLERFLAKYVSLNSFTQTIVETVQRGEIARWPVRAGERDLL